MAIENYRNLMTTKYSLKNSKPAALKFYWKDILWDPVDWTLSYYMRTSLWENYLRQNAVEEKKSIVKKSVFRSNKKERKGNCTQAGYLFMAAF